MSESFQLTNKNRELSERVIDAANSSRQINKMSSSLAKLRLSNMKLHGRESDMKVLKGKLMELKEGTLDNKNNINREICPLPEMVLISGVSGTGKSSLVMSMCSSLGSGVISRRIYNCSQQRFPTHLDVDVHKNLPIRYKHSQSSKMWLERQQESFISFVQYEVMVFCLCLIALANHLY